VWNNGVLRVLHFGGMCATRRETAISKRGTLMEEPAPTVEYAERISPIDSQALTRATQEDKLPK
jgi:hypothetical protein